MLDKGLSRINIIQSVVEKRMCPRDATHLLALTERQMQRLMSRFCESDAAGLTNLRRGHPGKHRLPESLKLRVLSLLHDYYSDFRPTTAAEKLRERHNITVSFETLRKCKDEWIHQATVHDHPKLLLTVYLIAIRSVDCKGLTLGRFLA